MLIELRLEINDPAINDEVDKYIVVVMEEFSHIHMSAISIKKNIEKKFETQITVAAVLRHMDHIRKFRKIDIIPTARKKYRLLR